MIKSRKDVQSLLNEYLDTQYEYNYQFWMPNTNVWNGKKQAIYSNGVVLGKFREKDIETIRMISIGVEEAALKTEIRENLENYIEVLNQLDELDIIQQKQLESNKLQLNDLQIYPVSEWIKKYTGWMKEEFEKITQLETQGLLFLYYAFENWMYERKHPYCDDLEQLKVSYKNILGKGSQLAKYGLIPLDSDRELIITGKPRVYDKSMNKTFFIKNIPHLLLKQIYEMITTGEIAECAVRLFNEPGYEGNMDCDYLAEALERGSYFDYENLNNYSISKLYSEVYENSMWIVIDPENITFEELCCDFDVYCNMIVTQVIHLKYIIEGGKSYITHIDHEYVFYTLEEYEKRLNNSNQKGEAKKRIKSFKIDNSKISFERRCNISRKDCTGREPELATEQFLCYVLECYFKHKDLLKEYFKNVII